jgi:hypothetical protein
LPWNARAYRHLLIAAARHGTIPFSAHEVRDSAYLMGLDRPKNEKAWGGVFKRAVMRGNIEKINHAGRTRWVCKQVDCGS